MAVRKRAPTRRARPAAAKSRVIKITSMEQWERILGKTGDALLFVYVVSVTICFLSCRQHIIRAAYAKRHPSPPSHHHLAARWLAADGPSRH